MLVSVEKPGSPEELVHVGVKGMKWGVRKSRSSTSITKTPMSKKKKVAIGVGIAGVVLVGAAGTAAILSRRGNVSVSQIPKHVPHVPGRKQIWDGAPFKTLAIGSPEWNRFHKMLFENPGGIDYPTRIG